MNVVDERNLLCLIKINSYKKGYCNKLDNMHMDNDDYHHADDIHDWCTTLIGVKFEIRTPQNNEHRRVSIIEEKKFFKDQGQKKTLISQIKTTRPNQITTRLRSPYSESNIYKQYITKDLIMYEIVGGF